MSRNSYSVELITECCSKYRNGESVSDIVKKCGVPRSTVYYWIKKYNDVKIKDITLRKTLDNVRRRYEKMQQICEVLKTVNCTVSSPLKEKLYELEKLHGQYSVRVLCEALEVDRGTFYNHIFRNKKNDTVYAKKKAELSEEIKTIYEESKGLFGSDKILSVLQEKGYCVSKKTVRNIMNELGIHSFRTKAKKDFEIWEKLHESKNVLQRKFNVDEPNIAWVSDCTQVNILKKKYYICAILDLYSRKVIAYKISAKASTQLVTSTFKSAYEKRKPDARLIFHSDRGCQYTSYAFRKLLIANNVTQSFSRSGTPYDNSVMESFFSSLKREEIYRTSYRSFSDFQKRMDEYMDFYNSKRPHRANNYKTPIYTEEIFYGKKAVSSV